MIVTTDRERLASALAFAERAAASRESMPVLSGVRLTAADGALHVTATDLEVTASVRLAADVQAPGDRVVDARLFAALVRRLPGPSVSLRLGEDGSAVHVESGSARFSLLSTTAEDFPELPKISEGHRLEISGPVLAEALSQTAFAAAPSDQRPVLSGILLELEGQALRLVATDGSRLAYREVGLEAPPKPLGQAGLFAPRVIVPGRAIPEIQRLCDLAGEDGKVELVVGQRLVSVQAAGGAVRLVTRLIEGNFPPYRQVFLEDLPTRVAFDRRGMLEAVQRASVLARRGPAVVVLEMGEEGVVVRAREADVGHGEDRVSARLEGPAATAAYQSHFLEEVLKAFGDEEMIIELGDPGRQATIKAPGEPGYRYIVMPVRLG